MRKFKHKNSNSIVSGDSEKGYRLETGYYLPTWIVENSNDWEEIKEFPKIISFRRISDKMLYTLGRYDLYWGKEVIRGYTLDTMITQGENTSYTEIYQVAVSKTEVFTLGDTVIIDECSASYNKGIIKYFKVAADGHIRVEVSNGCSVGIQRIKKALEPLFVTEDKKELYLDDIFYTTNTKYSGETWFPTIVKIDEFFNKHIYRNSFSTVELCRKYIDENKPIYSKKQVKEALEESYFRESYILDMPYCCADRFKENIFKQKLGL